eukprot:Tbor_TRINITY_DN5381_c0_g1::TRINITY_DN5381_c0_g1_i2::g.4637::m.4637
MGVSPYHRFLMETRHLFKEMPIPARAAALAEKFRSMSISERASLFRRAKKTLYKRYKVPLRARVGGRRIGIPAKMTKKWWFKTPFNIHISRRLLMIAKKCRITPRKCRSDQFYKLSEKKK